MSIDAQYRLETPEQVEMDFDLAGPGSRFCAVAIDYVIITVLVMVVVLLAAVLGYSVVDDVVDEGVGNLAFAIMIALLSFLMVGYFIILEVLMRGQTPGKRRMKLRVVRDDATPITFTDSLIRNLLRMVDFLPVAYLIGGMASLFHPMQKRLGDIAAGTIVIKEAELDFRAKTDRNKNRGVAPKPDLMNAELAANERQAINGFLSRRAELLPAARVALANRIAWPLYEKYGGRFDDPESYLVRLSQNRHHEP